MRDEERGECIWITACLFFFPFLGLDWSFKLFLGTREAHWVFIRMVSQGVWRVAFGGVQPVLYRVAVSSSPSLFFFFFTSAGQRLLVFG